MDDLDALFPSPPPPPKGLSPDLSVGIILAPHFSILPFAGFIDCLRHASDIRDHSRQIYCYWTIIAHAIEPIRASCGLEVLPQTILPEVEQFDYLVVAGGILPSSLNLHPEIYEYIQQAATKNIPVIGLCTGSFILAKAGLLDKHRCCVHAEHKEQFNKLFPTVETITDQAFVIDQGVITCPWRHRCITTCLHTDRNSLRQSAGDKRTKVAFGRRSSFNRTYATAPIRTTDQLWKPAC